MGKRKQDKLKKKGRFIREKGKHAKAKGTKGQKSMVYGLIGVKGVLFKFYISWFSLRDNGGSGIYLMPRMGKMG